MHAHFTRPPPPVTVSDPSLRFAPTCARGETPFRMTAWFFSALRAKGRAAALPRHVAAEDEFVAAEHAILVGVELQEARGRFVRVGLVGEKLFARELAVAVFVFGGAERRAVRLRLRGGDLRFGLGLLGSRRMASSAMAPSGYALSGTSADS